MPLPPVHSLCEDFPSGAETRRNHDCRPIFRRVFRAVNRLAIVKNLPHEINERQIAGFFSEADADLAEAERRDVELDKKPSLGLTLGEFDTKINGSAAARRPYPG